MPMLALTSRAHARRRDRLRDPFGTRGRGVRRGRHRPRVGVARVPLGRDRARAAGHGRAPSGVVGASGPPGLAGRARRRGARRGRRRRRRLGDDRRDRNRLHRLDPASHDAGGDASLPTLTVRRSPPRLPEALEAPRGPAAGRARHVGGGDARRAVARALRRPHLLRVAVRESPSGARGGSRDLRGGRPLDRGRGLDRLAALRPRDTERVHRRVQGPLPGRLVPLGVLPPRARSRLRRRRPTAARMATLAARRARGRPHARSGTDARAPGGDRGLDRERRRARHRAGRVRRRPRAHARGDGHLDVPRHERRTPRRGAGDVRRRRGRHHRRPARLRGRPERSRRRVRLGRRPPAAGRLPRRRGGERARPARPPLGARAAAGPGRPRPRRPRLAERQPLGPRRPRAERRDRRSHARHEARGHLPRARRGDRVRGAHHRRDVRRRGGPRARADRRGRARQEPVRDAGVRRRAAASAPRGRVRPGAGGGLGDPRRGRRGLSRGRAGGGSGDGSRATRRVPPRLRLGRSLRRALRPLHDAPRPVRPPKPDDAPAAKARRDTAAPSGSAPWRRSAPSSRGSTRSCRDTAS